MLYGSNIPLAVAKDTETLLKTKLHCETCDLFIYQVAAFFENIAV